MTVQKFEDLEVWKNARELCKKIREIVNTTLLGKDYLKSETLKLETLDSETFKIQYIKTKL